MDKRATPPKRVTSPTWGPPPPCKQALSAHKAYNSAWCCTSSKNPLRPLMFLQNLSLNCHYTIFCLDVPSTINIKSECASFIKARSIQPKFPEISAQNSVDRFGPTGKVSKKRVQLERWTGRTGLNFVWMLAPKREKTFETTRPQAE